MNLDVKEIKKKKTFLLNVQTLLPIICQSL